MGPATFSASDVHWQLLLLCWQAICCCCARVHTGQREINLEDSDRFCFSGKKKKFISVIGTHTQKNGPQIVTPSYSSIHTRAHKASLFAFTFWPLPLWPSLHGWRNEVENKDSTCFLTDFLRPASYSNELPDLKAGPCRHSVRNNMLYITMWQLPLQLRDAAVVK